MVSGLANAEPLTVRRIRIAGVIRTRASKRNRHGFLPSDVFFWGSWNPYYVTVRDIMVRDAQEGVPQIETLE